MVGFFLLRASSGATIRHLNVTLHSILAERPVLSTLEANGMESAASTLEQLAAALKADLNRWGSVVKGIDSARTVSRKIARGPAVTLRERVL